MKSRKVKKFLAILGTFVFVVTSMPLNVHATEPTDGEVVEETPVITEEEEQDVDVNVEDSETSEEVKEESSSKVQVGSPMRSVMKAAAANAENVINNTGDSSGNEVMPLADDGTTGGTGTIPGTEITTTKETPRIEVDNKSTKNVYIPSSSELTTTITNGVLRITAFNPTLQGSYDLVQVPGKVDGQDAVYSAGFLSNISNKKLGIIFESGATLDTSKSDLDITYVRFEEGSKASSASGTFKNWESLWAVEGFGEALAAYGNTTVTFKDTFNGCTKLKDVTLNLSEITAEFDGTFTGVNEINTLRIENGSITSISNLNNTGDHTDDIIFERVKGRTITLSNITFPSNDTDYLSHAFTNMNGRLIFSNCKSDGKLSLNFNEAYAGSTLVGYSESYNSASSGRSLEPGTTYDSKYTAPDIAISGVSAYSTKGMFESSQIKSVDLTDFITNDTVDTSSMFKGATISGIKGVDTWRLGSLTADEMFNGTRVYYGSQSYLTKTLIPAIKRLDWSKCASANKLFNFIYKGDCPIDYSGMNLSSVENMTVSSLRNYDFITAGTNPQNYIFEQDEVYKLRAGSSLGGKALDPVEVTDGRVAGADIPTNTHVYTDIATITITDVASDKEVSTAVVPGYKLSEYLDSNVSHYQDRSLTQAVAGDLVINSGDKVSVYCSLVKEVERELMEGSDIDFGEDPNGVEITLEDGSKDVLQGGDSNVTIKIESTTGNISNITVPNDNSNFNKYAFFNIDLVATVNGSEKRVTELSQKATVVLPLPDDYASGKVTVLNYHNGYKSNPIVLSTRVNKTAGTVTFDTDKFSPYVMLYGESEVKEEVTVTVDFTKVSDSDYSNYLTQLQGSSGKQSMSLKWAYDDNSSDISIFEFEPVSGKRVYTVKAEVIKKTAAGKTFSRYTELSFNGDYLATGYDSSSDLNTFTVTRIPKAVDSKETTTHNFVVKIVDNSNAGKTRPERLLIEFTAKYGDYTRSKNVEVNLKNNPGNSVNSNVVLPTTVGGVALSSLDATTSTATNIGYSSTWDNATKVFKYILDGCTDTDPNPSVVIDPVNVLITFAGDTADARPQKVYVSIADSNNQNTVTKEISTTFAPGINSYREQFQRLVDDTYHVTGVTGIDGTKYKVTYNGLNVVATYITGSTTNANYTRKVTINMEDNNDEAGIRPKSMKVTIANDSGSDTVVQELTVGSSNSFTFDISVMSATDNYKITGVSGLPEGYETTINGLTVTCKYKVEKIQKTYKVVWSGDADNADKTRPNSVQLTVKNSGTSVQTLTVSEDTNWTANAELNKLIKGVEASYSVEGADVTNYSKSVEGDTVTYTFNGTLSKDAAAIEAGKNGTNGVDGEGIEETYDIANFDWIDYANKYPDLKKAYGYNKEALYAHYIRYGIGEGRIATFTGKYATVNEDVLKAYFPDDYKYKTNLSAVGEEYLIGKDTTSTSSNVTVDSNGNIHTTVKNADGTTTETVTDAEGNIISVSTYKTGDMRLENMSGWFIALGILMLIGAALIISVVVKDEKRRKNVLSLIS